MTKINFSNYIKEISDFPKKGVMFKDITPLLENGRVFKKAIDNIAELIKDKKIDKIVGIDARGFLFAAPLAYKLEKGLALIRKKGKLPDEAVSVKYNLEYGSNTLTLHKHSIKRGESVAIVDDVLATGGTTKAAIKLIEKLGGKVINCVFLIELKFLNGKQKLKNYSIESLIKY